mmetsp:Transcript_56015/g.170505  ORF Transcript_56015/g.170505 Transcript_56015/m.170505 type:complete len:261 (-) Transcript_56015:875-1657(-)
MPRVHVAGVVIQRRHMVEHGLRESYTEDVNDDQEEEHGPHQGAECAGDGVHQGPQGPHEPHDAHDPDDPDQTHDAEHPEHLHSGRTACILIGVVVDQRRLAIDANSNVEPHLHQTADHDDAIQHGPTTPRQREERHAISCDSQGQLDGKGDGVRPRDEQQGVRVRGLLAQRPKMNLHPDEDRVRDDHGGPEDLERRGVHQPAHEALRRHGDEVLRAARLVRRPLPGAIPLLLLFLLDVVSAGSVPGRPPGADIPPHAVAP